MLEIGSLTTTWDYIKFMAAQWSSRQLIEYLKQRVRREMFRLKQSHWWLQFLQWHNQWYIQFRQLTQTNVQAVFNSQYLNNQCNLLFQQRPHLTDHRPLAQQSNLYWKKGTHLNSSPKDHNLAWNHQNRLLNLMQRVWLFLPKSMLLFHQPLQ